MTIINALDLNFRFAVLNWSEINEWQPHDKITVAELKSLLGTKEQS